VAEAVKDLGGGRAEVSKSLLAQHLKSDENSGVFSQRITSAKCFGLIEGRQNFSLCEASKRYFFPTDEKDKIEARLSFLSSPTSYAEAIKRFDGSKLPPLPMLANIFHREIKVPESWKDRTASFFIKSAQWAGAIDESGHLRFKAAMQANPRPNPSQGGGRATQSEQIAVKARPTFYGGGEPHQADAVVWSHPYQGMFVKVETPADIPLPLWEKLNSYVQVLKPAGNK